MARQAKPWFRAAEDYWYATHNGKQVSLGVRGRANEAAAWRAWEALRAGPPAPPAPPEPDKNEVLVNDVIVAFIEDAAGRVEPETLKLYKLYLCGFALRYGQVPASRMTCTVAEAYSRRPAWGDSTRSVFLAVLARAFYHAERARLIDRTPLIGLRKPPVASRAADVIVTAEDHEKLAAASPAPFRALLTFLHLTGCRPAEAAQLTAADIDWEIGTATVRQHKTKRKGKRRVIYLTPAGLALLRGLADAHPTGHLFRNRVGAPWTRSAIGMAIRKASKVAGLPKKIAYGYRHGFATDALAAGVPDAQVAELLGHSSTVMLHRHYSHLAARAKVMSGAALAVRGSTLSGLPTIRVGGAEAGHDDPPRAE